MKFLADMGISHSTIVWLRKQDFDVLHLREEGLHKLPDFDIIRKAQNEKRIVLTCDLDFGDIMAASGGTCPSVIIFRLEDQSPANVTRRLEQVLKESSQSLERGAIISVDEKKHRVRTLPI